MGMMWHIYLAAVICGAILIGIVIAGSFTLIHRWLDMEEKRRLSQPRMVTRQDVVQRYDDDLYGHGDPHSLIPGCYHGPGYNHDYDPL